MHKVKQIYFKSQPNFKGGQSLTSCFHFSGGSVLIISLHPHQASYIRAGAALTWKLISWNWQKDEFKMKVFVKGSIRIAVIVCLEWMFEFLP